MSLVASLVGVTLVFGTLMALYVGWRTTLGSFPAAVVAGSASAAFALGFGVQILDLLGQMNSLGFALLWLCLLTLSVWMIYGNRHQCGKSQLLGARWDLIASLLAVVLLATFITGVLVSPNNWDSLTYHLPRMMHWLQDGSLAFFETTDSRQNFYPPLNAYLMLTTYGVGTGDTYLFVWQWLAGVSLLASIVLLSQFLQLSRVQTAFALALALSMPMLTAQMSTTQNDLIASLPSSGAILAIFVLGQGRWKLAGLFISMSAATAILIKPTALMLFFPWLLLFVVILYRRFPRRAIVQTTLAIFTLCAALATPFMIKILEVWSEVQDSAGSIMFLSVSEPDVLASNLIRNTISQFRTPSGQLNESFAKVAEELGSSLPQGLNPPSSSPYGSFILSTSFTEDHASAPHVYALLLIVAIASVVTWKRKKLAALLVSISLSQLVCLGLFMQWQPWGNRFSFVPLALATPAIAYYFKVLPQRLTKFLTIALLALSLVWILIQPLRGLTGTAWMGDELLKPLGLPSYESPLSSNRWQQFFAHHPPSANIYDSAISAIKRQGNFLHVCRSGDWWEYPIWLALSNDMTIWTGSTPRDETSQEKSQVLVIGSCPALSQTELIFFGPTAVSSPSVVEGPRLGILSPIDASASPNTKSGQKP